MLPTCGIGKGLAGENGHKVSTFVHSTNRFRYNFFYAAYHSLQDRQIVQLKYFLTEAYCLCASAFSRTSNLCTTGTAAFIWLIRFVHNFDLTLHTATLESNLFLLPLSIVSEPNLLEGDCDSWMLKDVVFGSGIEHWDLFLAARQELDLRRANVISLLQCCALKLTSRTPSVTIIQYVDIWTCTFKSHDFFLPYF